MDVDPLSSAPPGFALMFGVVAAIVALGFVLTIGSVVYRSTRMARRGQNPLTIQEDLAWSASRSSALAPRASKAERLQELDALRDSGRITAEEHATARARILAE